MRIQFISLENKKFNNIDVVGFENPTAFDGYEYNIIDLASQKVWYSKTRNAEILNVNENLINLVEMMNKSNSKCIFILPQNIQLYYHYGQQYPGEKYRYLDNYELQTHKKFIKKLYNDIVCNLSPIDLYFEINNTIIEDKKFVSAFYFDYINDAEGITFSKYNKRITTICRENRMYFTFLNIKTEEDIMLFINYINKDNKSDMPNWIKEYNFYNDDKLKKDLISVNKEFDELNRKKNEINKCINENNSIKSTLIETGNELVNKVFLILNEIFKVNLNEFIDKKEEDGRFTYKDTTFVLEIKGVSTNVKRANVSQLDNHINTIKDDENDINHDSKLKGLLIINHQRDKNLIERSEINPDVIVLANRNKSLIIETITLLKIYEKFKNRELNTEQIYNLFEEQIGLLKI